MKKIILTCRYKGVVIWCLAHKKRDLVFRLSFLPGPSFFQGVKCGHHRIKTSEEKLQQNYSSSRFFIVTVSGL